MSARVQVGVLASLILASLPLSAQKVSGRVTDADTGESVAGAIVRSLNGDGKTLGYAMADSEGKFTIQAGKEVNTITIALLGYKEKTLKPPFGNNLMIALEPESLNIKESFVQAKKVRVSGDTTTYYVNALTTRDDLVLGDVLKRIPGIEISSSGHLKVDGRDLGKFYINGKEVLDGNYNLAIKKLPVDAVKKMELVRNYQYIKMLRDIQDSDEAAVNIVLDENSTGRIKFLGSFSGGGQVERPFIPNTESLTAFYLGDGFSSVEDVGFDASGKPSKEISYFRFPLSDNRYSIESKINYSTAKAPLSDSRTLFNKTFDSRTVNTLTSSGEFKAGASFAYSWDERNSSSFKTSTYHLPVEGDRIISHEENRLERAGKLIGRISCSNNASRHYISNVLFADLGKNIGMAEVSGDDIRSQRGERSTWDINNNLNTLFKVGAGQVLGIRSYTQISGARDHLGITDGILRQSICSSAIFEDLSINSIQRSKGDFTYSFQPGLNWQFFKREALLEGLELDNYSWKTHEQSTASYITAGITWNCFYRKRSFSFGVGGNLHYDRVAYGSFRSGKLISDESVSVKYESGRFVISVGGGISTNRPEIQDLGSVLILYDYDGLMRGQESLAFLPDRFLSGEILFREPVNGWHVRLNSRYDKTKSLLGGRDVLENYIVVYNTEETSDLDMWLLSARVTKGLYAINGSVTAEMTFMRSGSSFRQNGTTFAYVSTKTSPSLTLSTTLFNYWKITGSGTMSLNGMTSEGNTGGNTVNATISLTNTFYVSENVSLGVVTDLFHNSTTGITTLFPDIFVSWKGSDKLRLRLQASNLLNMREYSYTAISPLMETTFSYRIRPLSIMLSADWTF